MKVRKRIIACIVVVGMLLCYSPVDLSYLNGSVVEAADRTVAADETWNLEKDETVSGNLIVNDGSNIRLNGYKMTVTGDVRQSGGIINIGKGTLKINGDYYCRKSDGPGTGHFRMENTGRGVLDIDGNATFDTTGAGGQWYGEIRIGGELTVGNDDSFCPGNSVVTEF